MSVKTELKEKRKMRNAQTERSVEEKAKDFIEEFIISKMKAIAYLYEPEYVMIHITSYNAGSWYCESLEGSKKIKGLKDEVVKKAVEIAEEYDIKAEYTKFQYARMYMFCVNLR